ncbi:MAG: ACP S-malonyltransferase [Clostridiales bacterium]|nr:ACP S-malonyltransferase [Clostridiales bacterium]
MGKIAFVFAGQGAQYSGMGKDIYEHSQAAKRVFNMADSIRENTSSLCFEGTKEQLSITKNTQPALFCVNLACAYALQEKGITPDGVAGFSLGEIPALAFCDVLSDEDAFSLVCKRGEFMQECAEKHGGAMAAVLRLPNERVEEICQSFENVFPVNYNCDGQLVVAGLASEIDAFLEAVAKEGGRSIKLQVSGAFHTRFMEDASQRLSVELEKLQLNAPKVPLYSNYTALPYTSGIKGHITEQLKNPVLWQKTIENMIENGFTIFIEVGAGKVLSGLINKISNQVSVFNVEDYKTLINTVAKILEEEC